MKEIRQTTKREIGEALDKNRVWDLANKVLYDLCSSHPHHKTRQEVIVKVWLIGRSYSAAIERRKSKNSDSPGDLFYEDKVAPAIINSKIDVWFTLLKNERTPENAIATHCKLTALFYEITKLEKRSLASKYLHFHFRDLFFIYDSRSVAAIRKVTPSSEKYLQGFSLKEFDKEYANFFRRCLWLQKALRHQYGRELSPRDLDKILLYVADSPKK